MLIRLYWLVVPRSKRRACIFRTSCSNHVYQQTAASGLYAGIKAFKFRFSNCRPGFTLFENPVDGRKQMILPEGRIIQENEIAEKFFIN